MFATMSGLRMTTWFREFDMRRTVATSTCGHKWVFCVSDPHQLGQAHPKLMLGTLWWCSWEGREGGYVQQEAAGRFWSYPAGPQPFGEPSQAVHSPRGSSVHRITVLPPKTSVSFLKTLKTQPNKTTTPPWKCKTKQKKRHPTTSREESWYKKYMMEETCYCVITITGSW